MAVVRAIPRVLAPVLASATLLLACGGHAGHASSSKPSQSIASARTSTSAGAPGGDWPEFNFDPQRTGVGPADTGITAANVGQLRTRVVHIDGVVRRCARH